jgi:hypothetical protein
LPESIPGKRVGRVFLYPAPRADPDLVLRPITGTFNTRAFRKARKRAGLDGICWHDLRHTFASWLAAGRASDRVLQEAGAGRRRRCRRATLTCEAAICVRGWPSWAQTRAMRGSSRFAWKSKNPWKSWCRRRDSNPRPAHYECAALPAELLRPGEPVIIGNRPGRWKRGLTQSLRRRTRITTSTLSISVPSGKGGSRANARSSGWMSSISPVSTFWK